MLEEFTRKFCKKYFSGVIILIANVYGKTSIYSSKSINIESEFFTEHEFDSILKSLKITGYTVLCYFDENDFISDYLNKKLNFDFIVFNLSRNGFGIAKKSLIPTFCDLNQIKYTASNGYACSLARQKYHMNLILKELGLNYLKSYTYANNKFTSHIPFDYKLRYIIKPLSESASQGISKDSIFCVDNEMQLNAYLKEKYFELNCSPLLIQEFVEGYEAKTILIDFDKTYALDPVGVEINHKRNLEKEIITNDIAFDYKHSNYLIKEELGSILSDKIKTQALKIYEAIGMENYGRIDCRIDNNTKEVYFMDFSTMPYFVSGGEMMFAFEQLGMEMQELLNIIINSALYSKYGYSL